MSLISTTPQLIEVTEGEFAQASPLTPSSTQPVSCHPQFLALSRSVHRLLYGSLDGPGFISVLVPVQNNCAQLFLAQHVYDQI